MDNLSIFKDFLVKEGFNAYEQNVPGEGAGLSLIQTLNDDKTVDVLFLFSAGNPVIDIKVFGVAQLESTSDQEKVNQLLNELNKERRFEKYTELDGSIDVSYSLLVEEGLLAPPLLMQMASIMIDGAKQQYPRIIKAIG